jgi:precorrin-6A/cobalt-precorrin-6A reductase
VQKECPPQRLWLIGGTQDSAVLARAIAAAGLPCLVSVTCESARSLYPAAPGLAVWVGALGPAKIDSWLREQAIGAIVDASHPFAVTISQLAIAAAQRCQLPYLRWERPESDATTAAESSALIQHWPSLADLLASDRLAGRRVLLTLGYRLLSEFAPWQSRAQLFVRILPSPVALQTALQAGFTPSCIIALRPPLSYGLERSLWEHWQISLVVTKATGTAGGEDIKRQVARDLGVELAILERPPIAYPQQTQDVQEVLAFCLSRQNLVHAQP